MSTNLQTTKKQVSGNQQSISQSVFRYGPLLATVLAAILGIFFLEALTIYVLDSSAERNSPFRSPMTEYHSTYGWHLKANYVGPSGYPKDVVTYHINDNGYRGQSETNEQHRKVIAIGGTNGFGLTLHEHEVYSAIITRELQVNDKDLPLSLINLSIPGFGLDQQVLLLEREAVGLQPDIVLLLIDPESIYSIVYPTHRMSSPQTMTDYAKPYYTLGHTQEDPLKLENYPVPQNVDERQIHEWQEQFSSHTFLSLSARYLRFAAFLQSSLRYTNTEYYFGRFEVFPAFRPATKNWALFYQLILKTKSVFEENNIVPLFVIIPAKETFSLNFILPIAHTTLRSTFASLGLRHLDLLQTFAKEGGINLYDQTGGFLNANGHQLLAKTLQAEFPNLLKLAAITRPMPDKSKASSPPPTTPEDVLRLLE